MTATFSIRDDSFVLNGKPFTILSGALHYFRIPREMWADRIQKARLMGLNTIETYVPWNLHEPAPNQWDFSGNLDLEAFLEAVAAAGMYAIVRPGPYICAEFNNGGLPGWLFAHNPALRIRSSDPAYLEPVTRYLRMVYGKIKSKQIDRGGHILLVQIENEYGAYGDDHDYLRYLVDLTRECGITTLLSTVDQPQPYMLERGTLPELLSTGSFGSNADERLRALRSVQPSGPLMCSEMWCGWFDQWGEYHHTTSAQASAEALDDLLAAGASVNIYMVHGGTNFGLTNGANDKGIYTPIATSYDYDAPIGEAGELTDKFFAFREVIAKYHPVPQLPTAVEDVPGLQSWWRREPWSGGATIYDRPVQTRPLATVLARLDWDGMATRLEWNERRGPVATMDDLGIYEGFVGYRFRVESPADRTRLTLTCAEIRDRALVIADGNVVGLWDRHERLHSTSLPASTKEVTLLVEDMGRVNYGPRLGEPKGIIGPLTYRDQEITEVAYAPVPHQMIPGWAAASSAKVEPSEALYPIVFSGSFEVSQVRDLFVDTANWGKGLMWINHQLLGRYWSRGPQRSLYVPASFLREGTNTITVWEHNSSPAREFTVYELNRPDLGPLDL